MLHNGLYERIINKGLDAGTAQTDKLGDPRGLYRVSTFSRLCARADVNDDFQCFTSRCGARRRRTETATRY